MDYSKLQNGSDIRGVALEGIEGQHINLTETACKDLHLFLCFNSIYNSYKGIEFYILLFFNINNRLHNI